MDLATQRAQAPSLPWRQLGVLALIAILLGTALAMYVGSQPRLPEPFGPAANGVVSYESGGTIYLYDPETNTSTVLTNDAEGWQDPWFSLDGRTLLVAHEVSATEVEFGVLPVDGGEIRVITPEPLSGVDWLEWSADSESLILVSDVRGPSGALQRAVSIMDVEAGTMSTVDLDVQPTSATFVPPAGERILVVSRTPDPTSHVMTMLPDGSDPQVILQTEPGQEIVGRPALSPDGTQLVYGLWDVSDQRGLLHLFDLASGRDTIIATAPDAEFTCCPRFSPDGRTLFVERAERLSGAPTDGSYLAFVDIATERVTMSDLHIPEGGSFEWSPDGGVVVASVMTGDEMAPHVFVDPVTGRVTPAPWTAVSYPSWQRTAP